MLGLEIDTIPAALRAAAARWPDRLAYVEGNRSLTYAELLDAVERATEALVNNGVCCDDRVVIWGPNSIDWAVAALAVSYSGCVLVPVNSRYVGAEVADVVSRCQAALVFVHDGFLGRDQTRELREAGVSREVWSLRGLADGSGGGIRHEDLSPDDLADILFTSGTTGRSKGAMSAHRQTIGVARIWAELGGVTEDDRYLVVNPFFHSFGYKIGIVVGLLTGCTLYPVATFDVETTMRLVDQEQITVFPGAPTLYQSMLATDRSAYDLSSLRLAVTGAAVVPVVLIERMRQELGIEQVVTAFGMTEAVVATMCRPDDDAETVATTCGRPVPGMEARLGDQDELLLRGDFVMQGYLDDPEATRQAIDEDGWLHTGDVATIDERGNVTITDRLKDMYISGGFNVYPAEVEQVVMRLDGVQDVAVVGVPDERMGEVGAAYVVGDVSPDDVIAFAREHLANFKVPRSVVPIDALPRNLAGKVLKRELT